MGYETGHEGVKMKDSSARSLGTVGTVLGGAALLGQANGGGGILGGLFGGNCNQNSCVTQSEMAYAQAYNGALAENAALKAENFSRQAATQAFADAVAFTDKTAERQGATIAKLSDAVINQGQEIAVLKERANCLNSKLDKLINIK